MIKPPLPWPEERLALAEHLWHSGFKASYCAERCGVTRNAFLGMVHRKRWTQDPDRVRAEQGKELPQEKQVRARTRRARMAKAKPKPSRVVPEVKLGKVTMLELTSDTCRWPVSGDGASTLFCGRGRDKSREGAVYCVEHTFLAIRPGNPPKLRVPV
jgi:GcrA cell cycle regulator